MQGCSFVGMQSLVLPLLVCVVCWGTLAEAQALCLDAETPGPNKRSCYETDIAEDGGICTLTPLFLNQDIPQIQFQIDQSLSGVFSPGFFNGNETYASDLLCRYNVQCPASNLLYFEIIQQNLEGAVDGTCVDALRINRPSLNSTLVTCGSDNEGFADIEMDNLQVEFRTNSVVGDCGFFVFALCFDPLRENTPGCSLPITPANNRREKRSRRGALAIPLGSRVIYRDYMVSVIRQGEVVQRFDAIQVFQTFRRPLEFQQFIGSTSQTFPGAGILKIGNGIAFYIVQGVGERALSPVRERACMGVRLTYLPRSILLFLPNDMESDVITQLLEGLIAAFGVADVPLPVQGDPADCPLGTPGRDMFGALQILAEENANSCSAVLQGVANAFLEHSLGYQFDV